MDMQTMNVSSCSLWKNYVTSYKRYNVPVKLNNDVSCDEKWSWQVVGDCQDGGIVLAGNLILMLSALAWVIGSSLEIYILAHRAQPYVKKLAQSQVALGIISLIAAVLSLQVLSVILYELLAVVLFALVTLILNATVASTSHCHRFIDNRILTFRGRRDVIWPILVVTVIVWCALPLVVVVTSLLVVMEITSTQVKQSQALTYEDVYVVTGSVFAYVACCGHWALTQWKHFFRKEKTTSRAQLCHPSSLTLDAGCWWKTVGSVLLLSDATYIVGVTLIIHDAWLIVYVLPWLLIRFQDCVCQFISIIFMPWSCHSCKKPKVDHSVWLHDGDDEEDHGSMCDECLGRSRKVRGKRSTLGENVSQKSWDSEANSVLWRNAVRAHRLETAKKAKSKTKGLDVPRSVFPPKPPTIIITHDIITSTDTDVSTISQEYELEFEQELFNSGRNRPIICPFDFSGSECFHKRVETWISQSTPEEEMPPSLTMTLHLDSSFDDGSLDSLYAPNCGRKPGCGGVSSRKYSY